MATGGERGDSEGSVDDDLTALLAPSVDAPTAPVPAEPSGPPTEPSDPVEESVPADDIGPVDESAPVDDSGPVDDGVPLDDSVSSSSATDPSAAVVLAATGPVSASTTDPSAAVAVAAPGAVFLPLPRAELVDSRRFGSTDPGLCFTAAVGTSVHAVVGGRVTGGARGVEARLVDDHGRTFEYQGMSPVTEYDDVAVTAGQPIGRVAATPTGRPTLRLDVRSPVGETEYPYRLLVGAVDPMELSTPEPRSPSTGPPPSSSGSSGSAASAPSAGSPDQALRSSSSPATEPTSPPSPPPRPVAEQDAADHGSESDAASLLMAPGVPGATPADPDQAREPGGSS